jgi:hypothetical protein
MQTTKKPQILKEQLISKEAGIKKKTQISEDHQI